VARRAFLQGRVNARVSDCASKRFVWAGGFRKDVPRALGFPLRSSIKLASSSSPASSESWLTCLGATFMCDEKILIICDPTSGKNGLKEALAYPSIERERERVWEGDRE